jgi:hypothetical protein
LIALGSLVVFGALFEYRKTHRPRPAFGSVERLAAPRRSADAEGRAGDVILHGDTAAITVVAAPPVPGLRPLTGAIVDIATQGGDVPDFLQYLRPTFAGGPKDSAELPLTAPQPAQCDGGRAGIRIVGKLGLSLDETLCASGGGRFEILTTTSGPPPDGAAFADELNVGSLPVVTARVGSAWDTQQETPFIAVAYGGTALLLESSGMHLRRSFSRFGEELFPSPVLVRYRGAESASRSLTVLAGDVLTAVARAQGSSRAFDVTFGKDRGGTVSVLGENDREIASGTVERGATRGLRFPPDFGVSVMLRDDRGVVTDARIPWSDIDQKKGLVASASVAGTLTLDYHEPAGAALPVHVLFKGLGVPDPLPVALEGRAAAAGRSLYLFDGKTRVSLFPGRYRVTASHGISYSLSVREVSITEDGSVAVSDELHRAVDTSAWVAGDFHLHSAPSPDSTVLLPERVMSLVSEGIELAVATDHNHVTDFAPHVHALGAQDRLDTVVGVEITSVNQKWGHFNAYPLPIGSGAPALDTPVYYAKRPEEMFASARDHGARIVQVNHARMAPSIGYFDLANLDARTGHADPVFSSNFDAFEAYNGMWIETRDKVREGPVDLVALARRGQRVAAMGNSDSHRLLFEEAGYPRTFVHTPREPRVTLVDRVVKTLLAADTTVSSGPFVEFTVEGQNIGSTVKPGGATTLHGHVRVSAPSWVSVDVVEIWKDDAVVQSFAVDGPAKDGVRFEKDIELPVTGKADTTFLVWAEGKTPLPDVMPYDHALSIGFSGLMYVDADGDGTVRVPAGAE